VLIAQATVPWVIAESQLLMGILQAQASDTRPGLMHHIGKSIWVRKDFL
jgi:hypothetical protein